MFFFLHKTHNIAEAFFESSFKHVWFHLFIENQSMDMEVVDTKTKTQTQTNKKCFSHIEGINRNH